MRSENPSTPHVGESSKVSIIRLVLVLIVGLTMISIAAMLAIFFLSGKNDAAKEVNVNVTTPPATPFSPNTPIIRQAPLPSPAKPVKQPSMPAPPAVRTPGSNTNEQTAPKQTPQPLPSESPP